MPTDEVALFSMLSSGGTTGMLVELINKPEGKGKRGTGKKKFNAFLKEFNDSSPETLLNSMGKQSQTMFGEQIDKIHRNFQQVKANIKVIMSRATFTYTGLSDFLVEDKEKVTYLYRNLRRTKFIDMRQKATSEELEKMAQLFEKYAEKPKFFAEFDDVLNYNYAKLIITVVDSPLKEVNGFKSEKGPTDATTLFKTIVEVGKEQEKIEELEKKLQKKSKNFSFNEENMREKVEVSKNTTEFSGKYKKFKGFRFTSDTTTKQYRVANIGKGHVFAYLTLLRQNFKPSRGITDELMFKIRGSSIGKQTEKIPISLVKKTGNQYIPVDFISNILVSEQTGIKAYEDALAKTLGGMRTSVMPTSESAKRKVGESKAILSDFLNAMEVDITLFNPNERLSPLTPTIQQELAELEELKEEFEEELMKVEPINADVEFNLDEYNWEEAFVEEIKQEAEITAGEANEEIYALIQLAKNENEKIGTLMYDDSFQTGEPFSSDNRGVNLLNLLTVLESYLKGRLDDLGDKLYTPDQQNKEAEEDRGTRDAFLAELDSKITELQEKFKDGIKDKFQEIIDVPQKYPNIYGIKPNTVRERELDKVLPKQFFKLKTTDGIFRFIEVVE